MTLEEIQKRVEDIRATAGDDEVAHSREDDLRKDFIEYVASLQNESLAAKARAVLETEKIDFYRWCA
jgi:CHASE3 domain sensor protein